MCVQTHQRCSIKSKSNSCTHAVAEIESAQYRTAQKPSCSTHTNNNNTNSERSFFSSFFNYGEHVESCVSRKLESWKTKCRYNRKLEVKS